MDCSVNITMIQYDNDNSKSDYLYDYNLIIKEVITN